MKVVTIWKKKQKRIRVKTERATGLGRRTNIEKWVQTDSRDFRQGGDIINSWPPFMGFSSQVSWQWCVYGFDIPVPHFFFSLQSLAKRPACLCRTWTADKCYEQWKHWQSDLHVEKFMFARIVMSVAINITETLTRNIVWLEVLFTGYEWKECVVNKKYL